jgi:hypothetical protein
MFGLKALDVTFSMSEIVFCSIGEEGRSISNIIVG